jgi:hypothetical protein
METEVGVVEVDDAATVALVELKFQQHFRNNINSVPTGTPTSIRQSIV